MLSSRARNSLHSQNTSKSLNNWKLITWRTAHQAHRKRSFFSNLFLMRCLKQPRFSGKASRTNYLYSNLFRKIKFRNSRENSKSRGRKPIGRKIWSSRDCGNQTPSALSSKHLSKTWKIRLRNFPLMLKRNQEQKTIWLTPSGEKSNKKRKILLWKSKTSRWTPPISTENWRKSPLNMRRRKHSWIRKSSFWKNLFLKCNGERNNYRSKAKERRKIIRLKPVKFKENTRNKSGIYPFLTVNSRRPSQIWGRNLKRWWRNTSRKASNGIKKL